MPRLARLYVSQCIVGFAASAVFVALLLYRKRFPPLLPVMIEACD